MYTNIFEMATLITLMNANTIRDEVMYWLMPMDALNLRLTCQNMVPNEDMPKYTSVFKYIMPDRAWLMNKMMQGYNFTIINPYLRSMMMRKMPPIANTCMAKHESGLKHVNITLIVTKDDSFLECTHEFMPTHILAMG